MLIDQRRIVGGIFSFFPDRGSRGQRDLSAVHLDRSGVHTPGRKGRCIASAVPYGLLTSWRGGVTECVDGEAMVYRHLSVFLVARDSSVRNSVS